MKIYSIYFHDENLSKDRKTVTRASDGATITLTQAGTLIMPAEDIAAVCTALDGFDPKSIQYTGLITDSPLITAAAVVSTEDATTVEESTDDATSETATT